MAIGNTFRWRLRRQLVFEAFSNQGLVLDLTGGAYRQKSRWRRRRQFFLGTFGTQGLTLDLTRGAHRQFFSLAPSAPIFLWRLRRPRVSSGSSSQCPSAIFFAGAFGANFFLAPSAPEDWLWTSLAVPIDNMFA